MDAADDVRKQPCEPDGDPCDDVAALHGEPVIAELDNEFAPQQSDFTRAYAPFSSARVRGRSRAALARQNEWLTRPPVKPGHDVLNHRAVNPSPEVRRAGRFRPKRERPPRSVRTGAAPSARPGTAFGGAGSSPSTARGPSPPQSTAPHSRRGRATENGHRADHEARICPRPPRHHGSTTRLRHPAGARSKFDGARRRCRGRDRVAAHRAVAVGCGKP